MPVGIAGFLKLCPTQIRVCIMKKMLLLIAAIALMGGVSHAQKNKKDVMVWEEAGERQKEPEFKVFINPQVADVEFMSAEREQFGPYYFPIKSLDATSNAELDNFQSNATYRAMKESDADVIVAPVYHSYVMESDEKTIVIELTGYPAKYVNFRALGKNPTDFEMIRTVYPHVNAVSEMKGNIVTVEPQTPGAKTTK